MLQLVGVANILGKFVDVGCLNGSNSCCFDAVELVA